MFKKTFMKDWGMFKKGKAPAAVSRMADSLDSVAKHVTFTVKEQNGYEGDKMPGRRHGTLIHNAKYRGYVHILESGGEPVIRREHRTPKEYRVEIFAAVSKGRFDENEINALLDLSS